MSIQQQLEHQEELVLTALEDPAIASQLLPVTAADLKPGLVLIYRLVDTYGCHIIRSKADIAAGCRPYRKDTDLRRATEDGQFFTLPDNLEL